MDRKECVVRIALASAFSMAAPVIIGSCADGHGRE